MTQSNAFAALTALAISITGVSCKKKNADFAGSAEYGNGSGAAGDYAQYGSGSNVPLPNRNGNNASYYNASKGQFAPVYFAFDSVQVSSAELGKIRQMATYAKRNSSELIVAGFTDDVGTEEYNRSLGDRRALAVRDALTRSGLNSSKIQTVSFGEEMLADPSAPRSSRNRRVEFGLVR